MIGPLVTPIARRRPHQLARETVTLDRLSGGRLVLGVGLGPERHRRVRPGALRRGGRPARPRAAARRGARAAAALLGRRVRAAPDPAAADPGLGRGALAEPPPAAAGGALRRRLPDRSAGPGARSPSSSASCPATATTSWSRTRRARTPSRGPPRARPGA